MVKALLWAVIVLVAAANVFVFVGSWLDFRPADAFRWVGNIRRRIKKLGAYKRCAEGENLSRWGDWLWAMALGCLLVALALVTAVFFLV